MSTRGVSIVRSDCGTSGLKIEWLHEHAKLTWAAVDGMIEDDNGLYGWPDKPWLPPAFSLCAVKD